MRGQDNLVLEVELGRKAEYVLKQRFQNIEPAKITINKKNVKTSEILSDIEKQTGNRISRCDTINDIVLPSFEVENGNFWPVIDRLCRESGNVYGLDIFTGNG